MDKKSISIESMKMQKKYTLQLGLYGIPLAICLVYVIYNNIQGNMSLFLTIITLFLAIISPLIIATFYKFLIAKELDINLYIDTSDIKKALIFGSSSILILGMIIILFDSFEDRNFIKLVYNLFKGNDYSEYLKSIIEAINYISYFFIFTSLSSLSSIYVSMYILLDIRFKNIKNVLDINKLNPNFDIKKFKKSQTNNLLFPLLFFFIFPYIIVLLNSYGITLLGEKDLKDVEGYFNMSNNQILFMAITYSFTILPNSIINNFIIFQEQIREYFKS